MKGPETFLARLELALPSALGSDAPAVLSPELRTVVNGHFFWVADADELGRLRGAPHAYTGPLIDPVRHEWFEPAPGSPRLDVDGEILLFASAETLRAFETAGNGPPRHHHSR